MSKKYRVHYGVRYTADFTVEADSEGEAREIAAEIGGNYLVQDMDFADDDFDIWEES